ncbi:MAG: hypothetical protein Kow0032_15710 [Methyloligellaceae bacterium]
MLQRDMITLTGASYGQWEMPNGTRRGWTGTRENAARPARGRPRRILGGSGAERSTRVALPGRQGHMLLNANFEG